MPVVEILLDLKMNLSKDEIFDIYASQTIKYANLQQKHEDLEQLFKITKEKQKSQEKQLKICQRAMSQQEKKRQLEDQQCSALIQRLFDQFKLQSTGNLLNDLQVILEKCKGLKHQQQANICANLRENKVEQAMAQLKRDLYSYGNQQEAVHEQVVTQVREQQEQLQENQEYYYQAIQTIESLNKYGEAKEAYQANQVAHINQQIREFKDAIFGLKVDAAQLSSAVSQQISQQYDLWVEQYTRSQRQKSSAQALCYQEVFKQLSLDFSQIHTKFMHKFAVYEDRRKILRQQPYCYQIQHFFNEFGDKIDCFGEQLLNCIVNYSRSAKQHQIREMKKMITSTQAQIAQQLAAFQQLLAQTQLSVQQQMEKSGSNMLLLFESNKLKNEIAKQLIVGELQEFSQLISETNDQVIKQMEKKDHYIAGQLQLLFDEQQFQLILKRVFQLARQVASINTKVQDLQVQKEHKSTQTVTEKYPDFSFIQLDFEVMQQIYTKIDSLSRRIETLAIKSLICKNQSFFISYSTQCSTNYSETGTPTPIFQQQQIQDSYDQIIEILDLFDNIQSKLLDIEPMDQEIMQLNGKLAEIQQQNQKLLSIKRECDNDSQKVINVQNLIIQKLNEKFLRSQQNILQQATQNTTLSGAKSMNLSNKIERQASKELEKSIKSQESLLQQKTTEINTCKQSNLKLQEKQEKMMKQIKQLKFELDLQKQVVNSLSQQLQMAQKQETPPKSVPII